MWEQTDELQFVKRIDSTYGDFQVIETIDVAGKFYVVNCLIIDLCECQTLHKGTRLENIEEVKDFLKNKYGITIQ